jgi:hypothetical protein
LIRNELNIEEVLCPNMEDFQNVINKNKVYMREEDIDKIH